MRLQIQPFQVLEVFLERPNELITREELQRKIWPSDTFVDFEQGLNKTVNKLRVALCDTADNPKYIETVPRRGYRFIAKVETEPQPASSNESPAALSSPAVESIQPLLNPKRWVVTPSRRRMFVVAVTSVLLLVLAGSGWRAIDRNGISKFHKLSTRSGAAYTRYQTGRLYLERQHPGDHAEALQNFEAAIKLDPDFAAAYAGKADAEIFLFWDNGSHDDIARARLAINKALELDANSSYAHTLLCRIRSTYDWDFAGAESECRLAVQLDPENHEAHSERAFLLNSMGKSDDALREMDTAIAIAPTSFNKRSRGMLLYYARRFDEAISQLEQVEATDPEYFESRRWIVRCFEQKKDYPHALEFLVRYRESTGAKSEEIERIRSAFASGGWPGVLRASLPRNQSKPNIEIAGTFAQLGEKEKAFEVLDGMINARRVMIVHMDSDPRLDPLRPEPRYEELAKRIGLR